MNPRYLRYVLTTIAVLPFVSAARAADVGTGFSYQGQLKQNGAPANGNFDMEFRLFDAATLGNHVGNPVTLNGVPVSNGLFTVTLNGAGEFGPSAFNGEKRWLQITVDGSTLTPRQTLTAAPYALALPGLYTVENATSPNIIGGYSANTVTAGVVGATIAGGGTTGAVSNNRVTDSYGTIGGGQGNQAGDAAGTASDRQHATVGGGEANNATGEYSMVGGGGGNTASGYFSTVGGGLYHTGSGYGSTVGGGYANVASGDLSAVGGGDLNTASGRESTVGGGNLNTASGYFSTVGGGQNNAASGSFSTVPGGYSNEAGGAYSFAAGRRAHVRSTALGDAATDDGTFVLADSTNADFTSTGPNQFLIRAAGGVGINKNNPAAGALDVAGNIVASGTIKSGSSITIDGTSGSERISSSASLDLRTAAGRALRLENNATSPNLIGGWSGNTVTAGAKGATIAGGGNGTALNGVTDDYGTVSGGGLNRAGDAAGTTSDRTYATVGGGTQNTASGDRSTVSGGWSNTASGLVSTVGGGWSNNASGSVSVIAGGWLNNASADSATVGGGYGNTASGLGSTIGGGNNNTASGRYSTVPGGHSNEAGGDFSFAAGQQGHVRSTALGDAATDHGTFVWADNTDADFISTGPNQFLIRASGGVGIGTNSPAAKLDVNGTARVKVLEIMGADLAERFPVSDKVDPGMVVEIDPNNPGQLRLSQGAYNRRVAGVVSGANGFPAGAILGNLPGHEDAPAIALTGRVWVHCDTSNAPIEPGDLLTTSATPGHAMKVSDFAKGQGAIIGKAMTGLESGSTDLVLVLVSLQ